MDDMNRNGGSLEAARAGAESGNPVSQFRLGLAYYYGEGTKQDHNAAAHWFEESAKRGYVHAKTALGVCYRRGEGVLPDYIEAVNLFRPAADQGDVSAIYNLALCYHLGQGVSQDHEAAADLFRRTAELGNISEHYPFDSVPHEVIPEPETPDEAMRLYREATAKVNILSARFREDSLNKDSAVFVADENLQKIDLLSREKAELERALAAHKAESEQLKKQMEQQKADCESRICAAKDSADRQEKQLRGEIAALVSKADTLSDDLKQARETIRNRDVQNSRLLEDLGREQNASSQKDRTIHELQNKIYNQDARIQAQENSITSQAVEIGRLNTQKPFVKKVNILRWMDFFSIACLIVLGYVIYSSYDIGFLYLYDDERYICLGLALGAVILNILMLACLAKGRFIIHALLCTVELAAVAFTVVAITVYFSPAMVAAIPYGLITLWRICASPIKEIYFG